MAQLSISKLFIGLRSMFPPYKVSPPEEDYIVELISAKLSVTGPEEQTYSVPLIHMTSIIVEINDSGPWGMDVWFIILGQNDEEFCAYPLGATNDQEALDYFLSLSGFELRGMDCTENKRFICWAKPKNE